MFISWTQTALCLNSLLNSKWQRIWKLGKSSSPGKVLRCRVVPEGKQHDTPHGRAAMTEYLSPCSKPALGRQGERQKLGWLQTSLFLILTANCTNSLLEAEVHTPILKLLFFLIYLFLLLVMKKLQLQQAAVSTPTGSLSSTTGDIHHCWCDMQHVTAPTARHGSAHHAGHTLLASHGCSTINTQPSLASHPSFTAVLSTLAHELPLKAAPTRTLLSFLGPALAFNVLPLLKSPCSWGMAKDQRGLIFKRNYQVKVLCFPSSRTKQPVIRPGTEPSGWGTRPHNAAHAGLLTFSRKLQ